MRATTKDRVESCLSIGPPRGPLLDTEGAWYWQRSGWLVRYRIIASSSILHLDFNHGLPVQQNIKLDSTTPNYGGARWWFLCQCNQRVSRLHMPSDAYRFLCRGCHDLTYESAQSSRKKSERFFHGIARTLETTTREARRWFRVTQPGAVVHEVKRPVTGKVRDRRTGIALITTQQARRQGLTV